MKKSSRSYFALLLVGVIWGSTWMATIVAMEQLSVISLLAVRYLLAGSALVGYFLFKRVPLPDVSTLLRLSGGALLMFVFNGVLGNWSLYYVPSFVAAIIGSMAPLLISLFVMPSLKVHAAMLLSIIGVGMLMGGTLQQQGSEALTGYLLALAGVICWCAGIILMRRMQLAINRYYALGWQMLLGGLLLGIMALVRGEAQAVLYINTRTILALAYLVVPGSVIAFIALGYTYLHLPAGIASTYEYLSIVVTTLLGVIFLDEVLTINTIIGSVIVLSGIALVRRYDGGRQPKAG